MELLGTHGQQANRTFVIMALQVQKCYFFFIFHRSRMHIGIINPIYYTLSEISNNIGFL
jgi:hypothetical protein